MNDPERCPLCGERWFACGETMCPQPAALHDMVEAADHIEALEAALRGIAEDYSWVEQIQRTVRKVLAPEQEK